MPSDDTACRNGDITWTIGLKNKTLDIDLLVATPCGPVWNRYIFQLKMPVFIAAIIDRAFKWKETPTGLISAARRFPYGAIERTGHMKFVTIRAAPRPLPIVAISTHECAIELAAAGVIHVAGAGFKISLALTPYEFTLLIGAPGVYWNPHREGLWLSKSNGAIFTRLSSMQILLRMPPKK